jgi:hypothetical protein
MKRLILFIVTVIYVAANYTTLTASDKPRVIVLTDIENEPDDAMSMVRFLVYSNQWDVEGMVATTSVHQQNMTAAWRIKEIVEAYGKVRDNLLLHEPGFPTKEYLLSIVCEGLPVYGMNAVGKGKDSPGSELLIHALDKKDDRPVWVLAWGGPNVLAQALWKIHTTRSAKEVSKIASKLRVYTVSDQDDSGPWIRKTFPNLFYICSPGVSTGGGYHFSTWVGIGGEKFHGRFTGSDFDIVDNPWLDVHIRSKGPLGAQYPHMEYLMEGDSPTFLYLINNGLGNPEHPEWGSWGGRYEFYTPRLQKWFHEPETRPFWSDADDEVLGLDGNWHTSNQATIWRWRSAFQNDFVSRMDWTIKSFKDANHPPIPKLNMSDHMTAVLGDTVKLSAVGSSDPDNDSLSYNWFYYSEAGTFSTNAQRSGQPLVIENADKQNAWFIVPTKRVFHTGTMHVILAVTDNGSPRLTRYKRIIVTANPK